MKRMSAWVLGLFLLLCTWQPVRADAPVTVRWLGHACFMITAANGTRILLDPYGGEVGYPVVLQRADVVTVSHEHFDHNNTAMASGKPLLLHGLAAGAKQWAPVRQTYKGVEIRNVGVYHDTSQGQQRGLNTIFTLRVNGIHFAHAGDLGHLLTPEQIAAVGPVDVLMVPVGGHFTIDGPQAARLVEQLHPRLVIPMHYKTKATASNLPISDEQPFLKAVKVPIKPGGKLLSLAPGQLPKSTTVVTMDYP